MFKGLSLILMLLLSLTVQAENWPAEQWSPGPKVTGPALQVLENYAFPPRDDATHQGIRTDALLVIRDGQLIYCLLYTSPSPRDRQKSRMPSSA